LKILKITSFAPGRVQRNRPAVVVVVDILLLLLLLLLGSRDTVISIATGYGLDGRGVGSRAPVEARVLFSKRRLYRFWGP
jgi:hypothetical protein